MEGTNLTYSVYMSQVKGICRHPRLLIVYFLNTSWMRWGSVRHERGF